MNALFYKEGWDALIHGVIAGGLVLLLNTIGHEVFEAPEIPFLYGIAIAIALVVVAIRLFRHPHDGSHHEV